MPDDEQTPPEGPPQGGIPVPEVPLPITVFAGIVKTEDGVPLVMATALNPSGAMVQGILTPEEANNLGKYLLGVARSAMVQAPKKLQVVSRDLAVPA